jgi:hypothetical protein
MVSLSRDWGSRMLRCCNGETYVVPNGDNRHTPVFDREARTGSARRRPDATARGDESWAVLCIDCDRVLAVCDCPREEVYADL